jgi:hypothetical protein
MSSAAVLLGFNKGEKESNKKKKVFQVIRTQHSSPDKSIKKQFEIEGDEGLPFNNHARSIIESKNEYWRTMCWCELQKRRKTRTTVASIELRSRFERYDRWERKNFRIVDWKTFYDEMRHEKPKKPEEWLGDPTFLICGFVLMFVLFYFLVAYR